MARSASIIFLLIATSLCSSLAQEDKTENEVNRQGGHACSRWCYIYSCFIVFVVADSLIGLYGGDVRFTPGQQQRMTDASRSQFGLQNAVLNPDIFDVWEGAVVPYVLDSSLGSKSPWLR